MTLFSPKSTSIVIGCAITIHRTLGPGLFESVYHPCLAEEMCRAGLRFAEQVPLPVKYRALEFARGFRADFVVENELIVEIKSIQHVLPVHHSQVLTYMKLAGLRKGLLINFNTRLLKQGLKSFVM